MVVETFATLTQVICQSVIFLDLWVKCRNFHRATTFLFPDEEPEILGQLGGLIGRGCFGSVYHLYHQGIQMAIKLQRKDGPTISSSMSTLSGMSMNQTLLFTRKPRTWHFSTCLWSPMKSLDVYILCHQNCKLGGQTGGKQLELGGSIAARVNGFVAALLFANLLLSHLSLQVVGGEQAEQLYRIATLMRQTPIAGTLMAATQEVVGKSWGT